jgi:hypothetical protein
LNPDIKKYEWTD